MTLTEALGTLHAQGRIRLPWLPGMLQRRNDGPEVHRVDRGQPGDPRLWDWILTDPATVGCLLALLREASGDSTIHVRLHSSEPNDHVPPWVVCHADRESAFGESEWWEDPREGRMGYALDGPTEGEAIANALIALAGGTP